MRSRVFSRSLVSGGLVGAVLVGSLTVVPAALNGTPRNGGRPVIAKPVAAPAQPAAGRPFTVSFKVTRSDNGRPFLRGKMTGDPSIAGRVVQHTESFKGGTARVSLVVPANATGKTLRVAVAIRDGSTKTSRVATYRVQGRPSVSVGDASVTEGNAGTTPLSFPVTLSAASTQPVSVTYATADGTATAPSDYAAASGTLTFDPGETSKIISVDVVADLAIEQDESSHGHHLRRRGRDDRRRQRDRQDHERRHAGPGHSRRLQGSHRGERAVPRRRRPVRHALPVELPPHGLRLDGVFVYGTLDWGNSRFPIGADGSFSASSDSTGTVDGESGQVPPRAQRSLRGEERVRHGSSSPSSTTATERTELHERPAAVDGVAPGLTPPADAWGGGKALETGPFPRAL